MMAKLVKAAIRWISIIFGLSYLSSPRHNSFKDIHVKKLSLLLQNKLDITHIFFTKKLSTNMKACVRKKLQFSADWKLKLQCGSFARRQMVGHKNFPAKRNSGKIPAKKLFWNGKRKQLSCTCILSRLQDLLVPHSQHPPQKNNVFITFSPLHFLTSSTLCLESASIQKYLYKRCNFHFPSPPHRPVHRN